jgi:tetrahydromethanopterin S-methyltransferase subunit F
MINNQTNSLTELSIDEIAEVNGGADNRVVAATRMVQKGVMRAGPWGFAAGVVIAIGLEVYERTQ